MTAHRKSLTAGLLLLVVVSGCRKERKETAATPVRAAPVEAADVARSPAPRSEHRRLIWIGLDGVDREYMAALSAAGRVPNWTTLAREGWYSGLESFVPLLSPIVWTTQETGVGPDVHRVLDFQEVDPSTGLLVPVSEASRKAPAVWNVASARGRRVGVVGFWATHPAEKVNGFFLSDRVDPHGAGGVPAGTGYPEALDETVRRVAAREAPISADDLSPYVTVTEDDVRALPATPDFHNPLSALSALIVSTRVTHRLARELYDANRPDFLAVYFEGTDEVGHLFAPYAPPRLACTDESGFERFRRVPETYFAMVDAVLGQWMRRAKEDGAILVVTSDHGFRWGADRPCGSTASEEATAALWHRKTGVLLAWGSGVRPAPPDAKASAFDVAPTLLSLLGLPVAPEMPGSPVPVLPGLSAKPERGLLATPVQTVAAGRADPKEAAEYTKKLVALGYISPQAQSNATAVPRTSAGLTRGAWNNLGIYRRYSRNDLTGARAAWEESLRLDPGYHSPLFNIATLERDRGRYEEAARWLLRAIAAGHPNPEATIERWAGEFERRGGSGLVLLRAARAAYPGNELYTRSTALLLARRKECGQAHELIAPLETSNDPETLNVAAIVEACLDRPDVVRKLFVRSLELRPDQPRVREALAALPH